MKKAFTLAEVLITLVIIGVIAAMTIPTLINNTNKQELVTGLKKANSTLSQAVINMANNNDSTAGDFSFLNNVEFADEFAKVANVAKKCNNTADCFASTLTGTNTVYKLLNNSNVNFADGKAFITADGQIYTYIYLNSSSSTSGITTEDSSNALLRIIVDVNGHKSPNIVGRDVFYFYLINGKGIIPGGASFSNDCNNNGNGYTCAGKVLRENAMNY